MKREYTQEQIQENLKALEEGREEDITLPARILKSEIPQAYQKAYQKAYDKAYNQRPEVKAHKKAYYQRNRKKILRKLKEARNSLSNLK